MTIAQTDQRLFKGSTAEILAFMPPSFDESTGGGVDQDVVVYWQVWGVSRRSYRACGHAGPDSDFAIVECHCHRAGDWFGDDGRRGTAARQGDDPADQEEESRAMTSARPPTWPSPDRCSRIQLVAHRRQQARGSRLGRERVEGAAHRQSP